MNARPLLLLLAALSAGCAARQPPRMLADPAPYEVRDTAEYDSMLSGGEFAVLVRNGVVIDSVDLFFGVHRLTSGAVVFLPVKPVDIEEMPHALDVTEHVAFDGRRRIPLNTFLPHFTDYFSSPSVIDGILYYWGLQQIGDGEYRIHAHRYDARRRDVRSLFLLETEMATDNRGHLAPPRVEAGGIRFESYSFGFIVSPDLKSKRAADPGP